MQKVQTKEDLDSCVGSDILTVIDFYADWCGPCNAIAPVLEALAQKMKNIRFYKLNIEEGDGPEIVQKYKINSIPTFILFQNGQQIGRYNSLVEMERFLTIGS